MPPKKRPTKKITKDGKIDVRVPQVTRDQADKLAAKQHLTLGVWLQLLIEKEYQAQQ